MVSLPRLVVAAPSTGQGKTTIATGLMAALRSAGPHSAGRPGTGLSVSGHKVGPDYIDPGYHALATGRPGRNLDPHLVGEDLVVPLLLHGAAGADVAVVEGVMGLYDGRLGADGFASTAHVATLTSSPVVLVLDVAKLSRTAGAIVAGMAAYDPAVTVAGVVLNRAGSDRNTTEIRRSIERLGIPVLGALPTDARLAAPSRHLGLVPAAERDVSVAMIGHLGEQVARHFDLDALLAVARTAPDLDAVPWDPAAVVSPPGGARPVVAVAGGRAFTFRYAETEELLRAAGCEVVAFDPLTDAALPPGTSGIYLGGGFPEVYAGELAANRALLRDLRNAVRSGVPTVAECAGLLYLAESLDGAAMADVVPATAAMSERLTLRYPTAVAASDSLLARAGEQVTGHEFHRTRTSPESGAGAAWTIDGAPTGFVGDTWHASYLHVHWAGHPHLAQRFAGAVHRATPHARTSDEAAAPATVLPDVLPEPLRHHGDTEVGAGLADFAVNVYSGDRPAWLDRALHRAVDASASYPDVVPARDAVAHHHGRDTDEVLVTAGAAEAFSLVARLREWAEPAVVHPQFTEPHAALEAAGHEVTVVLCRPEDGFALDPAAVPDAADLVVVGNPTNPTGVLHPAAAVRRLLRPGRLVVVDEAFMDAVPGEAESLVAEPLDGLLVIRSLTKHWAIPGIRAGYVVGDRHAVTRLADLQTPWAVSTPAIAATVACTSDEAAAEARDRAVVIAGWRDRLEQALRERGIEHVPSAAPFVLARLGAGAREALRSRGVAVRRADTFPGLDRSWARIAVRPPHLTARLLTALDQLPRA
ncbi:cobyrinate a,c-diamide synthase [Nocardioides sp. CER19]|uniref:cobyrinate a,c-diamide synthase n=1 Tax=Nocardioides sp. CER19 TaxID=3038538 RepID=UPI00244815D5|nr:cobyrinate a,c-diamide synthase [Nocardioides sp. CER19]MDH2416031.1 cobyrinate a,c-diamide synthase [Nocardioides sp. CER19]